MQSPFCVHCKVWGFLFFFFFEYVSVWHSCDNSVVNRDRTDGIRLDEKDKVVF